MFFWTGGPLDLFWFLLGSSPRLPFWVQLQKLLLGQYLSQTCPAKNHSIPLPCWPFWTTLPEPVGLTVHAWDGLALPSLLIHVSACFVSFLIALAFCFPSKCPQFYLPVFSAWWPQVFLGHITGSKFKYEQGGPSAAQPSLLLPYANCGTNQCSMEDHTVSDCVVSHPGTDPAQTYLVLEMEQQSRLFCRTGTREQTWYACELLNILQNPCKGSQHGMEFSLDYSY